MKTIKICIIIFMPFFAIAQPNGVDFQTGLDWDQILAKAKTENKSIFVDCYATWCAPCKEMDKYVYTNDTVGEVMNKDFISIKVQFDSTKKDDINIKRLYPVARFLEAKYKITALPTYLFFSATGEPLHRGEGSQTVQEFVGLIRDARNPGKQLYTLMRSWEQGTMSFDSMPALINKLRENKEDSLAFIVAKDYMHRHLDTLSNEKYINAANLVFLHVNSSIITTEDRAFKLYYEYPNIADYIFKIKDYSKGRVKRIITQQEIYPYLRDAELSDKSPDWKMVEKKILRRFNVDAKECVLQAREDWYYGNQDWKDYCELILWKWEKNKEEFKKYSTDLLNIYSWAVCVEKNDKKSLKAALDWIDIALVKQKDFNAAYWDTKAHILYKLKRVEEAMAIVNKLIEHYKSELKTETHEGSKSWSEKLLTFNQRTLDKMKEGKPIKLYH